MYTMSMSTDQNNDTHTGLAIWTVCIEQCKEVHTKPAPDFLDFKKPMCSVRSNGVSRSVSG